MLAGEFRRKLLCCLADGRFHSGTELAEVLGVSRTAVWKNTRELESLGLEVAALPGKGYRLMSPLELLDEAAIREHLSAEAALLLAALELHEQIDSTNSHLMRAGVAGAPTGAVCLAETQTAGRGRVGRDWISPFGANVYLSVLWRFDEPSRVAGLSLAVGVAVVRALASLGVAGVGLKWPNDLLWGDAKLGGILLEVVGETHGPCRVVVGVGLNSYLQSSAGQGIDQAWTDLARVVGGGAAPPRNRLIAALLSDLLPMLKAYAEHGLEPYLPEWRQSHHLQGREAVMHQGETNIRGRIEDVAADGLLVMRLEDGSLRRFASGDVRLRVMAE